MVTIKDGPKLLFPRRGKPGAYEGHAFFEASSIRKVDGKYCFVYSSEKNHDLCYAMADSPFGPFTYGGRLVDIGDLGIDGNENEKNARNYLGNTHGGMVFLNGSWYIFYHRQTNQNSYARQACAEKLERNSDGSFRQAELTSCGLNQGPLIGMGRYSARIACNLWSGEGTGRYDGKSPKKRLKHHPYFTQSGTDREKDGDQYSMGGKSVEKEEFTTLYQALMNVFLKSDMEVNQDREREEVLRIVYNMSDEAPNAEVVYYTWEDEAYYAVEINGAEQFLVDSGEVDALIEQVRESF